LKTFWMGTPRVIKGGAKPVLADYETSCDRNGSSQGLPPYGGVLRSIIAVPLFAEGNKCVMAISQVDHASRRGSAP